MMTVPEQPLRNAPPAPALLRFRYVLALALVAAVAVASQVLLQRWLRTSEEDSRVVNLAGRQRMLSERIIKQTLLLATTGSAETRSRLAQGLQKSIDTWVNHQHALKARDGTFDLRGQNSAEVQRLYEEISPHFDAVVALSQAYADTPTDAVGERLLAAQETFLLGMDTIVFQYDREARQRVQALQQAGTALLGVLLLTILFSAFFVFRPTVRGLETAFERLTEYGERMEMLVSQRTAALRVETDSHKETIDKLRDANGLLEKLALKDALTGLGNRRYFDQALENEWRRTARDGEWIALVLIDIDFFKQFNDSLGHPAGDACLRAVGGALGATVGRPGDIVARYGGEEFAFILPATDADGAQRIAENARANVAKLAFPHPKSAIGPIVSISLGVSSLRATFEHSPALLIAQADNALYMAKHQGRDRVAIHQQPAPDAPVVMLPRHG
ncbi:MAG: diguanylate cyclase [Myxococcaceae bacterium]|nr:diguanylate cyclase [Myxococcaceae bacterium]